MSRAYDNLVTQVAERLDDLFGDTVPPSVKHRSHAEYIVAKIWDEVVDYGRDQYQEGYSEGLDAGWDNGYEAGMETMRDE